MESYTQDGTIGEGTYGVVLKARHSESGQIVAIKKFKESDEDEQVRKTALREVRILKQLRHENIVSLIEVFRRKRKLYLVFEYVESTLLEALERHPEGLEPGEVRRIMWQLIRGVDYLHSHQVIHRDVKPENLLLSRSGILKLCDFGFARTLAGPGARSTTRVRPTHGPTDLRARWGQTTVYTKTFTPSKPLALLQKIHPRPSPVGHEARPRACARASAAPARTRAGAKASIAESKAPPPRRRRLLDNASGRHREAAE